MIHALDDIRQPFAACFEEAELQLWKAVEDAAAGEGIEGHEHGQSEAEHVGAVTGIEAVGDARIAPAAVNAQRQALFLQLGPDGIERWLL